MTVRLAQISDAHLSAGRPFFDANFALIAQSVREAQVDGVLATGDLALEGEMSREELAHAVSTHAAIGPQLWCVPGNHDVGNHPQQGRNAVDAQRIAAWQSLVGASAWVRDLPGWRLIGYDNQSLQAHPEQWEVIERGARDAGTRSVALIQHMPLTENTLTDEAPSYWTPPVAERRRLMSLFASRLPAVVLSGHIHQFRDRVCDGIRQIWAPSTAFIIGDAWQRPVGTKVLGWVEHAFHADGTHDARLRTVDAMSLNDIGTMPQVYRPMKPVQPQSQTQSHPPSQGER